MAKVLGVYEKIEFSTIKELREFLELNYGDAYFYNDWTGDVYPVLLSASGDVCIGSDAFENVTRKHLANNIFGYRPKMA